MKIGRTQFGFRSNLDHEIQSLCCRPPDWRFALLARSIPVPKKFKPSREHILYRDTHAGAIQLRFADKAIAHSLNIALVHDIVQAEIKTAEHRREYDVQLSVSQVDADAIPRAAAEGYIELVDAFEVRISVQPAFGTEFERLAEDLRGV